MRADFLGGGARVRSPDITFGCVPMPVVIFACYQPATLERLKMDKDELRLDVAEALGKATALICLQTALVAALKAKGVLTDSEVATLSGVANETLVAMEGVPDDARELAQSALRGFALSWSKRVTRN
jgi:hypothetical protein